MWDGLACQTLSRGTTWVWHRCCRRLAEDRTVDHLEEEQATAGATTGDFLHDGAKPRSRSAVAASVMTSAFSPKYATILSSRAIGISLLLSTDIRPPEHTPV